MAANTSRVGAREAAQLYTAGAQRARKSAAGTAATQYIALPAEIICQSLCMPTLINIAAASKSFLCPDLLGSSVRARQDSNLQPLDP
jgi:hypothetical protein